MLKIEIIFEVLYRTARESEVDEPHTYWAQSVMEIEIEQVVEPKALLPKDLVRLVEFHGGYAKAAIAIDASEAFVRQNCRS